MDHLDVPRVGFVLGGNEGESKFSPLFKSVIMLTLEFGPNGIFLGVGSVPPTTGQSRILLGVRFVPLTTGRSISETFSKGFHL